VLAAAETAKLKVGDKAPKLQAGKWVQGEPVKEFQKGTAYIVEFWATWCGPCRATIPHLNELHTQFKDKGLVVIGQNVWERDEAKVVPFVKQMGDKMTYRVAMDDKSAEEKGAMAVTWMEAAGQNGIPAAFVVNKEGTVAWIGHPATLKEKTLTQILDGSYDLQKAAAEKAEEAKKEAAAMKHQRAFATAMRAKNWDDAEAAAKAMVEESGNQEMLPMLRAQIAMGRKDYKAAFQQFELFADKNADNAMMQNQLSWTILTRKDIPDADRDLKLALKLAERAAKLTQGREASVLDTLARAQFMNGLKKEAVATQERAVKAAPDDEKKDLQASLESYRKGELPAAD
jgi:thiol-disulfide isomerase/thioredoxin/Flp pilus assembly protein TadD